MLDLIKQNLTPTQKLIWMYRIAKGGGGGGGTLVQKTVTDSSGLVTFTTNVAKPMEITSVFLPVQSGTGDPSPSNVRPISGYTGVEILQTNGNLIPLTLPSNAFAGTFGANATTISSASRARCFSFYIGKNKDLFFQKSEVASIGFAVAFADTLLTTRTDSVIYGATNMTNRQDYTLNSGDHPYIVMCSNTPDDLTPETGSYDEYELMLSFGDSRKTYAPRMDRPNTAIAFPSAAGTVYGGTLTINEDGTGKLVSTKANISSYNGETLNGEWISSMDVYAVGTTPTTGAQVVHNLTTPVTYDLTAQQVQSLIGTNNIWHDLEGDITVKYYEQT